MCLYLSCKTTVPDSFGKLTVLSAVGSITVKVVSKLSEVVPSNVNEFVISIVDEFTVVVVPFTVKLPAITTSFGIPIVTVPAFSTTLISLAVPAKVKVSPKFTGDVLLPSETVIELFDNDELPILVIVLSGPLIVLFVKVVVDVPVIIVLSTAKVKSLPEIVEVIPVPPKILIVSPLAEILVTVELSSANLTIPLILVPSPIAVYISVKLLLIFSAPRRRLSPVPSFGVGLY